jgi:hypothetical protein
MGQDRADIYNLPLVFDRGNQPEVISPDVEDRVFSGNIRVPEIPAHSGKR